MYPLKSAGKGVIGASEKHVTGRKGGNTGNKCAKSCHSPPTALYHPGLEISSRRIVGRVLHAPCDGRRREPQDEGQECWLVQVLIGDKNLRIIQFLTTTKRRYK